LNNNILHRKLDNGRLVPVLPCLLVPFVLAYYHLGTHAGINKLKSLISLSYFWPKMSKDIKEFCKGCILCSTLKHTNVGQTRYGIPRVIPHPRQTFQIDVLKMSPSNGYHSILTIIDLYSGYVIPVALKSEKSDAIAKILDDYIFKIFGPPKFISSDNAQNLSGSEIKKLLNFNGTLKLNTVAYSPTSHANVENANRNLTTLVRIFTTQFGVRWTDVLSLSANVLNTVPRLGLDNFSPYFLMFGQHPHIMDNKIFFDRTDLAVELEYTQTYIRLLREFLLKARQTKITKLAQPIRSFPKNSLVLEKDFSLRPYKKLFPIYHKAPLKILKEYSNVIYEKNLMGQVKKISKNNLKKCHSRSAALFGSLPLELKLILGEPMDPDIWDTIKLSGNFPRYLECLDTEISDRITRSRMQQDTDVLLFDELDPEKSFEADPSEDFEILVSDSAVIHKINELFQSKQLNGTTALKDIVSSIPHQDLFDFSGSGRSNENTSTNRRILRGISKENIVEGGRRRTVKFNSIFLY